MYNMDEIAERLGLTGEREAVLHVTLLRELALIQPITLTITPQKPHVQLVSVKEVFEGGQQIAAPHARQSKALPT